LKDDAFKGVEKGRLNSGWVGMVEEDEDIEDRERYFEEGVSNMGSILRSSSGLTLV